MSIQSDVKSLMERYSCSSKDLFDVALEVEEDGVDVTIENFYEKMRCRKMEEKKDV